MLLAHFPAGYLLSRLGKTSAQRIGIMIGSVLPDLDILLWLTDRSVDHHKLFSHFPVTWLGILLCGAVLQKHRASGAFVGLGIGGLLHLVLDSVINGICWWYPFQNTKFALVSSKDIPIVPAPEVLAQWPILDPIWVNKATLNSWVVNMACHWTAVLELSICLAALVVWVWQRRQAKTWA